MKIKLYKYRFSKAKDWRIMDTCERERAREWKRAGEEREEWGYKRVGRDDSELFSGKEEESLFPRSVLLIWKKINKYINIENTLVVLNFKIWKSPALIDHKWCDDNEGINWSQR